MPEYDIRFVDAILFGSKTCPVCGSDLPRSRDYFASDASRPDGLTSECRSCRRAQQRKRYEAAKNAKSKEQSA